MMKELNLNTPIKIKVKEIECTSEAVTRYIKKYGYKPVMIATSKGLYQEPMWDNGEWLVRLRTSNFINDTTVEIQLGRH